MNFSRLELSNFGPIENFVADLEPVGLHFVVGSNGSGKTHVVAALLHSILGDRAQLLAQSPGAAAATKIRVVLAAGEAVQEATVLCGPTDAGLDTTEPEYAPVEDPSSPGMFARIRSLLGNPQLPRLVLDSEATAGMDYDEDKLAALVEDVPLTGRAADAWRRLAGYIRRAAAGRRSMGECALLDYAAEYHRRTGAAVRIPLIIDEPFAMLDASAREIALGMLSAIAERDQVIILGTDESTSWATDGEFRLWTLPGTGARRAGLGIQGLEGVTTRLANIASELNYSRRLLNRLHAMPALEAVASRASRQMEMLRDEVRDELRVLRADVARQSQQVADLLAIAERTHTIATQGLELAVDTNSRVRSIQDAVSLVLAKSDEIMESLASSLADGIEEFDAERVEAVCDDIATRVVRQVRTDLAKRQSLADVFALLHSEFGDDWGRLASLSQQDVALSWLLRRDTEMQACHLAILQVCRALEHEVMRNIFIPFREQVQAGGAVYPKLELVSLKGRPAQSYKGLYDWAVTGTAIPTLGSFGWITHWAAEYNDVALFASYTGFLADRFGDKHAEIAARLVSICKGPVSEIEPGAASMAISNVRNACAHPPSLAGDQAAVADEPTFKAIWRFALKEPLEVMMLLARSAAT